MYAGMPASRSSVRWSPPSTHEPGQPAQRRGDGDGDEQHGHARGAHRAARSMPSAPRTTAVTSAACTTIRRKPRPGGVDSAARSSVIEPEADGREHREQRDHPADEHRDPGPAGHQRQHREHRQHDPEPPRRAEVVEPAQPQLDAVGGRGRQQPAVEQQPLARAVQQRREPPRREQHRDHGERDHRRTPGRPVPADAGQQREREQHHDDADEGGDQPGQRRTAADQREQQPGAPGRAPASVRLRVREAERGVREPGQQRGRQHRAEAALAPGAGDDRHQRVRRGTPQDQPAVRAGRGREPAGDAQEPPRPPERERDRQHQQRRHGGGRAAAEDGGQQRHRQHVRRRGHGGAEPELVPGGEVQRPPVAPVARAPGESPGPETCPSAERAPTSIASTVTASSTATGLVRKRATSPVSSTTSSSSSRSRSVVRRAANDDGSRSAAAARRRSATSEADWVSAVARSLTASRPCR